MPSESECPTGRVVRPLLFGGIAVAGFLVGSSLSAAQPANESEFAFSFDDRLIGMCPVGDLIEETITDPLPTTENPMRSSASEAFEDRDAEVAASRGYEEGALSAEARDELRTLERPAEERALTEVLEQRIDSETRGWFKEDLLMETATATRLGSGWYISRELACESAYSIDPDRTQEIISRESLSPPPIEEYGESSSDGVD